MQWKDLSGIVGKAAPVIGGLLGGKLGEEAGVIAARALGVAPTPDAVAAAVQADPEAAVKLAQIESDERVKLADIASRQGQQETDQQAAVNATMRAEAASEHWPTYTWRPFIGFVFGFNIAVSSLTVLAVYVGILFGNQTAAAAVANLPALLTALTGVNATALPILGVASWFRGKMQADPAIPTVNRG